MSCNIFPPWICDCNNTTGRKNHPLAANAFHQLTDEQREGVYRDLYGIDDPIPETVEFIKKKLEELDGELVLMSDEVKKYYKKAIDQEREKHQTEEYITNIKFKVMFLRAERYDTKMSARRLVRYFKEKYELFGVDKLASKITQLDIGEEATKVLASGTILYTGSSDGFGRPIVIGTRNDLAVTLALRNDVSSMQKAFFYLFQTVIEDNEVAQIKGIVLIGYNHVYSSRIGPRNSRGLFPVIKLLHYALPCRFSSNHHFYVDLLEYCIVNLILVLLPKEQRARCQIHKVNNHEECKSILSMFNINIENLPLMANGEFDFDAVYRYLDKQRESEMCRLSVSNGVVASSKLVSTHDNNNNNNNNDDDQDQSSGDDNSGFDEEFYMQLEANNFEVPTDDVAPRSAFE